MKQVFLFLFCVATFQAFSQVKNRYSIFPIYEMEGVLFCFPHHGTFLSLKKNVISQGREYFKKKATRYCHGLTKLASNTEVHPFMEDCVIVDTLVFRAISLKYPLEIDGELVKTRVKPIDYSNLSIDYNNLVTIRTFQLVDKCDRIKSKHFEVISSKK